MIAAPRQVIFDYLDASFVEAVFRWYPDDMTELPCIVVGRPSGELTATPGFNQFPVFTVGRNLSDEAQDELDTLADAVNLLLIKGIPDLQARLIRYVPATESIGGSEFPTYVHTIEVFGNYC